MSANTTIGNADVPSEVKRLQMEARVLDLCSLAKRATEKLASSEAEMAETRQRLNNFVEARADFNKKAAHAAKVLAGCGAIGNDKVDEFVNRVAEDPSGVWEFVEKMAESISAPTLGRAADQFPSRSVDDPWSRLILGECQGTGYVD